MNEGEPELSFRWKESDEIRVTGRKEVITRIKSLNEETQPGGPLLWARAKACNVGNAGIQLVVLAASAGETMEIPGGFPAGELLH